MLSRWAEVRRQWIAMNESAHAAEQWETFKRAARREKTGQDPDGADRRQPVDSRLSGDQAPGLLPRSRSLVPVQPEDHARVSGHHLRPLLVDGVRDGGGALGARREDQVLAGQYSQRIPHAVSPGRHRPVPGIRSGGGRLRGADAAPHRHAAAAHPGPRLHPAHGHLARAAVHRRLRARHHAFHDRPGGESRRARTG